MDFFTNLQRLCTAKGITVTRLLLNLGISTSKGTAWKNGATPKLEVAEKIADYLDVSIDYLLGKTDKKNKPTSALGDGLSDDRRYLIEAVQAMSDENVQKLRIIVEQVIAERGK